MHADAVTVRLSTGSKVLLGGFDQHSTFAMLRLRLRECEGVVSSKNQVFLVNGKLYGFERELCSLRDAGALDGKTVIHQIDLL
jgi:hypothetical protein